MAIPWAGNCLLTEVLYILLSYLYFSFPIILCPIFLFPIYYGQLVLDLFHWVNDFIAFIFSINFFCRRIYQDSTQFYCLLPTMRLIKLDFVNFFFNSSLQHNHLLVIHQICQSILQAKRLMLSCEMKNLEGTFYNLIALRINITFSFQLKISILL